MTQILSRATARLTTTLIVSACILVAATVASAAAPIVTADIKAGIEKHIDDQVAHGEGFFTVNFEGKELKLKLVRVHMEYLASLGPERQFACVDMASDDGQFYDVDFFLDGGKGNMTVTETTVHKLNGRPYYLWQQDENEIWVRTEVDDASNALLGVLDGTDRFEFKYQATLPQMKADARCWIPLAETDDFQNVTVKSTTAPGKQQVLTDSAHGNSVLFLELTPADSGKKIEIIYDVVRKEKSAYAGDATEAQLHLRPERMVPADATITATAIAAVGDRQDDLMKARALYDHVMDQMNYKKFGEGWGQGDARFACDSLYGNCTDYHAYFIGLARAVNIPARFAIGASIPSDRDVGGTDGYHCWAEFYAEGKWWPVDISEADKFSALSMYFFGHHPANRFEFTRGRDLVVEPGPASGPINFLAYPLLEVDGQAQRVATMFLFEREPGDG
ncbi:MAG: transglutaminase-like domain-containing protein [Candidatus Krumholzibacteria bacterium]|nr:transglutaminase-like domain-containing protein [Candidatus Krumholzibacteria bacterium]